MYILVCINNAYGLSTGILYTLLQFRLHVLNIVVILFHS